MRDPVTTSHVSPPSGTARRLFAGVRHAYREATWVPYRVAEAVTDLAMRRAEQKCAAHPEWAEVKGERQPDGSTRHTSDS